MQRNLLVGAIGAIGGLAAVVAFPLRVHIGEVTVAAPASYALAALFGAVCAMVIWRAIRGQFGH